MPNEYVPITERERQSHSWVSLNGEDWACAYCDTKTGRGMCPGNDGPDPDEYFASLGSKAERGEAEQVLEDNQASYEIEAEDTPF